GHESDLVAGVTSIIASRPRHEIDGSRRQFLGADEQRLHDRMGVAMNEMKGIFFRRSDHAAFALSFGSRRRRHSRPFSQEFRTTGLFCRELRFRRSEFQFGDAGWSFLWRVPIQDDALVCREIVTEMPFGAAPVNSLTGAGDDNLTGFGILDGDLALHYVIEAVLVEIRLP